MKTKRLWAVLLSLVMTVSMIPSTALAVETTEETKEISEAVTEEAVEEETADDAEETTVTEEAEGETSDDAAETVSDENEETEEETDEETDAAGESEEGETPAEPENTEDTAEEELQEGSAAEEEDTSAMPAQTFEGKAGDIEVSVVAEAGAFYDGTEMVLEEVKAKEIAEAVADEAGEGAKILAAVNITFVYEGKEVEPARNISVSIKTGEKITAENPVLFHVDDKGTVEAVEDEQIEEITDEGVAFVSDAFSIYAVVDPPTVSPYSRLTLKFYKSASDTEPIAEEIVKQKDIFDDELFPQVVYDPGVGDLANTNPNYNVIFNGWNIGTTEITPDENGNYTGKTIEDIRAYLQETYPADTIEEGTVLNIYARILKVFQITYQAQENTSGGQPVNIAIGADQVILPIDSPDKEYTIPYSYNVPEETQDFEGWYTADGGNIVTGSCSPSPVESSSTGLTLYQPKTTMRVSGDVAFTASAPRGFWLTFHEVKKGATYTAPKFFVQNEATTGPETLSCPGYDFEGWYLGTPTYDLDTGEITSIVYGDEFTIGTAINQNTDIYAKWSTAINADYTVIIWKESLDDTYAQNVEGGNAKNYVFDKQYVLRGNTSEDVKPISTNNTQTVTDGDNQTYKNARVNGTKAVDGSIVNEEINYTGYHFANFDPNPGYTVGNDGVSIDPSGKSVINVYYDRNTVKYIFYYPNANYTVDNRGGWGIVNGKMIRLRMYTTLDVLHLFPITAYAHDFTIIKNTVVYNDAPAGSPPHWVEYTGTRYYRPDRATWYWDEYKTITGLYNEPMDPNDPDTAWPDTDAFWWYEDGGTCPNVSGSRLTFKDAFLPNGTNMVEDYYGKENDDDSQPGYVAFYTQDEDDPTLYHARNFILKAQNEGFQINDKYTGYHAYASSTGSEDFGFTQVSEGDNTLVRINPSRTKYVGNKNSSNIYDADKDTSGHQNVAASNFIAIYYNLDLHKVVYNDGIYVNNEGIVQTDITPRSGELHESAEYPYRSDISFLNNAEDQRAFVPEDPEGYVFNGWYADQACTKPYVFTTMPQNNISVYAKWIKIEYRVFLYSNLTSADTQSLEWGSPGQQLNFRVPYGQRISVPTGMCDEYELVGWFTDKNLTKPYNEETELNKETVTTPYTKEEQTDPTELPWGVQDGAKADEPGTENPTKFNKDRDQNRFWITEKFELWAKWRKVLPGATGINVQYDVNVSGGGTGNAPVDPLNYKDGVKAIAQAASKPADSNKKKFIYWIIQKYDENKQSFVDTDEDPVYPGESFTVRKEYSQMTDVVTDPQTNEITSAKYTIRLRAEYIDVDEPTPTHIYWYANNGLDNLAESKIVYKGENVQMNESVEVKTPGELGLENRPGYKFVGWARMDESDVATVNKETGEITRLNNDLDPDLVANDLFLEYDGTEFKLADESKRTIEYVAADEKQHYHAMVAVWSPQYYIYHTGVQGGDIQANDYKRDGNAITPSELCGNNVLYGGYYIDNLTKADDDANLTPDSATSTKDGNKIRGNAKYDGANWTFATPGATLQYTPQPGDVIYIKEVPQAYLLVKFHVVYNAVHENGRVKGLLYLVDADDKSYDNIGIRVTTDNSMAITDSGCKNYVSDSFYDKLEVKKNGAVASTRTAYDIFNAPIQPDDVFGGVLADKNFYETPGEIRTVMGFWTTKDGVTVFSNRIKTISTGSGKDGVVVYGTSDGTGMSYRADANPGVANGTGIATTSMITADVESDSQGSDGSVLRINADDTYAVKKIFEGQEKVEKVRSGDLTGQIEPEEVDGKVFAGWYTDPSFKTPADFSNVSADMTVYGKYIKKATVRETLSAGSVVGGKVTLTENSITPKGIYAEAGVICKVGDTETRYTGTASTLLSTKYTTKWSLTKMKHGTSFTVTPYYVTNDGTVIYGSEKNCKVNRLTIVID